MTSIPTKTDALPHQYTTSWLDEIRTEINVLFKLMLNTVELFTDFSYLIEKDSTKRKNLSNDLPNCTNTKNLEISIMQLLSVVARLKTLVPAPDSCSKLHQNTATGCMMTPYTQTNPKDSYVSHMGSPASCYGHQAVNQSAITTPRITIVQDETSSNQSKSSLSSNYNCDYSNYNSYNSNADDMPRWEEVKTVPKRRRRKGAKLKISFGEQSDPFDETQRDDATVKDSETRLERDRLLTFLLIEEDKKTSSGKKSANRSHNSIDGKAEFRLPPYLLNIYKMKCKEPATTRAIEFAKGGRNYFDFEDYYNQIMLRCD